MRHSKCLQFYIKEYYSEILLQMQFLFASALFTSEFTLSLLH